MTEQLNPDEKELTKIEAMFDSMTEQERLRPELLDERRMDRVAKGSGRKKSEVKELIQKFTMMRQVMGSIGANPGLLGRIPGFRQLGQLQKLKGLDLSTVFGKDAKMMEKALAGESMAMPQVAPGYTPPMGQAAMAKARLMGYSPVPQGKARSDAERDALKERRKRERQARKKNRRRK
jgi:signal recognition particle subunit SRP54